MVYSSGHSHSAWLEILVIHECGTVWLH